MNIFKKSSNPKTSKEYMIKEANQFHKGDHDPDFVPLFAWYDEMLTYPELLEKLNQSYE